MKERRKQKSNENRLKFKGIVPVQPNHVEFGWQWQL